MDLTPDQVKHLIDNRPNDVSPQEIVQGLMDHGHNLLPPRTPNFMDSIMKGVGSVASAFEEGSQQLPLAPEIGQLGKFAQDKAADLSSAADTAEYQTGLPLGFPAKALEGLTHMLPSNASGAVLMGAGPLMKAIGPEAMGLSKLGPKADLVVPAVEEGAGKATGGVSTYVDKLAPNEAKQLAAENYTQKATKLAQTFGPEEDMAVGTKIQKSLEKASQAARDAAGQPYEELKLTAEQLPVRPARPENFAKAVRASDLDLDLLPPSLRGGKLARFIKDEQTLNPSGIPMIPDGKGGIIPSPEAVKAMEASKRTLPELFSIRQELSQVARTSNRAFGTHTPGMAGQISNQGRIAHELVDAIDADLGTMTEGTDFMDALKEARKGWQKFKETYSNDTMESLMHKDPSEVGKFIFDKPGRINDLNAALGQQGLDLAKKSVVNDIVNKMTSSSIRNPSSILQRLVATKPDEFSRMFSPKELSILQDFGGARDFMMNAGGEVPLTGASKAQKALALAGKFLPPVAKAAGAVAVAKEVGELWKGK